MPFVVGGQRRRRDVVAAAADLALIVPALLGGFRLVQALQRAVMALVQAPVLLDRNPHLIERVERVPEGADRSFQYGREGGIEYVPALPEQPACFLGFLPSSFG